MQLSVTAADWDLVLRLLAQDRLEDALMDEDGEVGADDIFLDSPPIWDSCNHYRDVIDFYLSGIRPNLTAEAREVTDRAFEQVINDDMRFPNDLPSEVSWELVAGALSPERVAEISAAFSKLDYEDLARVWDQHVYEDCRSRHDYLPEEYSRGENAFAGYLRSWGEALRFAAEKKAGILIHQG